MLIYQQRLTQDQTEAILLSPLHTVFVSAIPASSNSSRAAAFNCPDVILFTSVLKLFRSDLNSLNLIRRLDLRFGGRLLASRSIFLIWWKKKKSIVKMQMDNRETSIFLSSQAYHIPILLHFPAQILFQTAFASFVLQLNKVHHQCN